MKHLKHNIIAAVDIETTGTIAGHHEIIQIAIIPLKRLRPIGCPFYTNIRPNHPERRDQQSLDINGLSIEELMEAPSQKRVIDLFEEWFEELNLPIGGKIIVLAHNAYFERDFLRAWLGQETLDNFFHYLYRDAMTVALAIKDKMALVGKTPFESVSLTNLCKVYGVTNKKPHDALADALAEAELYRTLLG